MSSTIDLSTVSTNGLGLMQLTVRSPPIDKEQAFAVMNQAIKHNLPKKSFFNGGEFYGPGCINLVYVQEFFAKYPEQRGNVIVSIKGAIKPDYSPDVSRAGITNSIDNINKYIPDLDIFEPGRISPDADLTETVAALDEAVDAGKIKAYTFSEIRGETLKKLYGLAKHKPVGIEVELSLFSRHIIEDGTAAIAGELGVPIIAYSPLSRGLLTGAIMTTSDLPEKDLRRMFERFQEDNIKNNSVITQEVIKVAQKKGVTPAQVALAWVKYHSGATVNGVTFPAIIPIPSCTSVSRVDENFADVELTSDEFKMLNDAIKGVKVLGSRYAAAFEKYLNV